MEYFKNWPLKYYRTLKKMAETGYDFFYYDVDNDTIVDNVSSNKYDIKPYRKSKTYMIVGKSSTINKIYKEINEGKIPEIPKNIKVKIDNNLEKNAFVQKLLRYDKSQNAKLIDNNLNTKISKITNMTNNNKIPKSITLLNNKAAKKNSSNKLIKLPSNFSNSPDYDDPIRLVNASIKLIGASGELYFTDSLTKYVSEMDTLPDYYEEVSDTLNLSGISLITLYDVIDGCNPESKVVRNTVQDTYKILWNCISSNNFSDCMQQQNYETQIGFGILIVDLYCYISTLFNNAKFDKRIINTIISKGPNFLSRNPFNISLDINSPNYLDIITDNLSKISRPVYNYPNKFYLNYIGLNNTKSCDYQDLLS